MNFADYVDQTEHLQKTLKTVTEYLDSEQATDIEKAYDALEELRALRKELEKRLRARGVK